MLNFAPQHVIFYVYGCCEHNSPLLLFKMLLTQIGWLLLRKGKTFIGHFPQLHLGQNCSNAATADLEYG